MPLGAQPRRARGTVGQPYSALNIRMVLAAIGLIAYAALAGLAFALNHPVFGTILAVLAATALADLVVIQLRRRARRRTDPQRHSLFE